jgi:hypothetical protein
MNHLGIFCMSLLEPASQHTPSGQLHIDGRTGLASHALHAADNTLCSAAALPYFAASSHLTVCKPGFGGDDVADCNACGGDGNYGSYGPSGRDTTQCVQCPKSEVGFQFWYENVAKPYMPDPRAVAQAQDASECVAAMAQIEDGLWYLAGAEGDTATDADDIGDCATRCLNSPTCALATFNYAVSGTASCKILEITAGDG